MSSIQFSGDLLKITYKICVIPENFFSNSSKDNAVSIETGTGFVIPYKGENYLITAGHLVFDPKMLNRVAIMEEQNASESDPKLTFPELSWVGCGLGRKDTSNADVCVMKILNFKNSIPIPLCGTVLDSGFLIHHPSLGDDVMFLGYPKDVKASHVLNSGDSGFDRNFPIALVHKGIFSGFCRSDQDPQFWIHSNSYRGASGGPVICAIRDWKNDPNNVNYCITGIVSAVSKVNKQLLNDNDIIVPTGFVQAVWIRVVIYMIDEYLKYNTT